MFIAGAMTALSLFTLGSMFYVFQFRGGARWTSVGEYVRKGWPVFAPMNCLLYMFTQKRAARPILDVKDFPEVAEIQKHWQVIRDEALQLYSQKHFEHTSKPENAAYYDLGFRTFYKYGWSKFYLNWYGYTHASAQRLCPATVEILSRVPEIHGAMFSVLPAGSQLTRHLDPIACSLRYHLGLATPNSDECFINVDGQNYSWRDGEAFMFDETYLHHARNNADQYRMILMCDVARPMSIGGRIVHFFYSGITKLTVVPNMEGDKRGLVNTVFGTLAPALSWAKNLKQSNRLGYLAMKYAVNTTLILAVVAFAYCFLSLVVRIARQII